MDNNTPTSNLDKYGREEDIFLKLNILSDPTISVTTRFTLAKGRKISGTTFPLPHRATEL
jgi:hypothetical protein